MLIDVPTISLLHFTTTIAASYGNCLTLYNIIFTYPSKLAACFGLVLFCHKKKCTGKTRLWIYSPVTNTHRKKTQIRVVLITITAPETQVHALMRRSSTVFVRTDLWIPSTGHQQSSFLNKCHFTCTKRTAGLNLLWRLQCCRFAVCLVLSVRSHLWLVSLCGQATAQCWYETETAGGVVFAGSLLLPTSQALHPGRHGGAGKPRVQQQEDRTYPNSPPVVQLRPAD